MEKFGPFKTCDEKKSEKINTKNAGIISTIKISYGYGKWGYILQMSLNYIDIKSIHYSGCDYQQSIPIILIRMNCSSI